MNLSPTQTLVLSMSGGKDSTATALHLLETGVLDRHVRQGGTVRRVFLDTGWELDETYAYLDEVLEPRLGRIERAALWVPGPGETPPAGYDHLEPLWATPGKTMAADRWALARVFESRLGRYSPMVRMILQWSKVPTSVRRWCTEDSKRKPIAGYLARLDDPVNVVGIRAEESPARALLTELEHNETWDAWIWRPILRWTREDVIAVHTRHGLAPNPLYLQGEGSGRVGCGPCVHSGKADIRWLARHHGKRLDLLRDLEAVLRELPASWQEAGAREPHWFGRSDVGDDGRPHRLPMTVDEAVAWSKTKRGGRQGDLGALMAPPGCSIWGLCEVPREQP